MKYRVCPDCGANLDHNERCTCARELAEKLALPKIRAGDTVKHIPTGEIWTVCGVSVERQSLIPEGESFPARVDIAECAVIEQGDGQSYDQREKLKAHGLMAYIER